MKERPIPKSANLAFSSPKERRRRINHRNVVIDVVSLCFEIYEEEPPKGENPPTLYFSISISKRRIDYSLSFFLDSIQNQWFGCVSCLTKF